MFNSNGYLNFRMEIKGGFIIFFLEEFFNSEEVSFFGWFEVSVFELKG